MKTILVCLVTLHPWAGEPASATVLRIKQKSPEACALKAVRQKDCVCAKPGEHPKFKRSKT